MTSKEISKRLDELEIMLNTAEQQQEFSPMFIFFDKSHIAGWVVCGRNIFRQKKETEEELKERIIGIAQEISPTKNPIITQIRY